MKNEMIVYYQKYREILVYVSLGVVLVAFFIPLPWTKEFVFSIGCALAAVMLDLLFSIWKKIDDSERRPQTYIDIDRVIPRLRDIIARDQDVQTKVRILSITFYKTWEPMKRILLENNNVDLEYCTLDQNFSGLFSSNWPLLIEGTDVEVSRYIEKNRSLIKEKKIKIKKHVYAHTPIIHGFLVNDSDLFLGFCWWTSAGDLEGAERPYLYVTGESTLGRLYIALFLNSFAHAARTPTEGSVGGSA